MTFPSFVYPLARAKPRKVRGNIINNNTSAKDDDNDDNDSASDINGSINGGHNGKNNNDKKCNEDSNDGDIERVNNHNDSKYADNDNNKDHLEIANPRGKIRINSRGGRGAAAGGGRAFPRGPKQCRRDPQLARSMLGGFIRLVASPSWNSWAR